MASHEITSQWVSPLGYHSESPMRSVFLAQCTAAMTARGYARPGLARHAGCGRVFTVAAVRVEGAGAGEDMFGEGEVGDEQGAGGVTHRGCAVPAHVGQFGAEPGQVPGERLSHSRSDLVVAGPPGLVGQR